MKTKIASFFILLSLISSSVTIDIFAQCNQNYKFQSQALTVFFDSVCADWEIISDRTCCPIICSESERPEDCIPRYSDASMCGECNNIRTGEIGIYTQDLIEPNPDTTFADALGRFIKHGNRINNEISNITSKLTALKNSMKPFERKVMIWSVKPNMNEKKKYGAALLAKDTYEADLAKLQQLQSAIYKLSSDLFLLTLSNQFKKVE